MKMPDDAVLVVDLDGTLLLSDSLWETFWDMLRHRPWRILRTPFWLLKGKAAVKAGMVEFFDLKQVACWPYNKNVLTEIQEAKNTGACVCLLTAAHESIAKAVAEHLGVFDHVFASSNNDNLSGRRKLIRLRENFGERAFDYIGDSRADMPVWAGSRRALVVASPESRIAKNAERVNPDVHCIPVVRPGPRDYLKAVRAYQWTKNALIFAPLLMSLAFSPENILNAVLAAITFSFCASIGYIVNDLLDLSADRCHPAKRRRPFAAGVIPLWQGSAMLAPLLALTVAIALCLPPRFHLLLGFYAVLSFVYSAVLKRQIMLDVIVLAGFYVLRLFAGAIVIHVMPSNWFFGFASFIFMSLGLVKRVAELRLYKKTPLRGKSRRGYTIKDIGALEQMAAACGFCAIAILALYIDSIRASNVYARPYLLWAVCPIVTYWFGRVLLITHRGEMHHDPVRFTLTDRASRVCVAAGMAALALAA